MGRVHQPQHTTVAVKTEAPKHLAFSFWEPVNGGVGGGPALLYTSIQMMSLKSLSWRWILGIGRAALCQESGRDRRIPSWKKSRETSFVP